MKVLPPGSTIGIIGGGQLGRMLAIAAAQLGYRVHILDPDPQCCAGEVAAKLIVADYDAGEPMQDDTDERIEDGPKA